MLSLNLMKYKRVTAIPLNSNLVLLGGRKSAKATSVEFVMLFTTYYLRPVEGLKQVWPS